MAQKQPAQEEVEGKKRPVHKIPVGRGIRAVIWENGAGDRSWFTVQIVRTYQTESGPVDTDKFGRDELLHVAKASHQAFDWILELQQRRSSSDEADA